MYLKQLNPSRHPPELSIDGDHGQIRKTKSLLFSDYLMLRGPPKVSVAELKLVASVAPTRGGT